MFFEEKLDEEFACQKQVSLERLERGRCWTDNSPLDLENETIKSNENVHCLQRLRRHNIVDLCMQLPDQTKKTNISKTEIQYAWQKRKPLVKLCCYYIQRASLKCATFCRLSVYLVRIILRVIRNFTILLFLIRNWVEVFD